MYIFLDKYALRCNNILYFCAKLYQKGIKYGFWFKWFSDRSYVN